MLLGARPGGRGALYAQPIPEALHETVRTADLVVVGAGAMGGWTAYFAQAGGAGPGGRLDGGRKVALIDAWGAGHPRATSGDETRIIRAAHGNDRLYSSWSRRALELWRRYEREWSMELVLPAGMLWFAARPDGREAASAAVLSGLGIPHERLTADDLVRRWPQIAVRGDLDHILYEPEAGAIMARKACLAVAAAFQRTGGSYAVAGVMPGRSEGGRLLEVVDRGGRAWSGGQFVFAAGPWLPRLFPELLGDAIRVTKQDVLFVGPPAGDRRFHWRALPAWTDVDGGFSGIGATEAYGMKVVPQRWGPAFDPTHGERVVDVDSLRLARVYLRSRFPALAHQPVVETRVCQYEMTADGHFLLARHPAYDNVWLAGGGSGHAFKHGPRIGEYLVSRLDGAPEGAADGDDEMRFRIGPRLPTVAASDATGTAAAGWDVF
jgi:sarcosine oxidase